MTVNFTDSRADMQAAERPLTPVQTLPTSAARAVATFTRDGERWLAIAQMSKDVAGEVPYMNGGDSNVDALFYRWEEGATAGEGAFTLAERLSLPGGEDVEHFTIGTREFLACVGIRTGSGPYDLNTHAVLYERLHGEWREHQRFEVFAGKQWRHFEIDGRHFLGLAQGVTVEGPVARHPDQSCVFAWNGERFAPFQATGGRWGYNWAHIAHAGKHYVAYADHVSGSRIFRWNGSQFETLQTFDEPGGRAFHFFVDGQTLWLVHANLLSHTTLYRFDGVQFIATQTLDGAGGRELCEIPASRPGAPRYLLQVRFITGTPKAPEPVQQSVLWRWRGDGFDALAWFDTSGGTDASTFEIDGQRYVVVTNSLDADVRFRVDSVVYRFSG